MLTTIPITADYADMAKVETLAREAFPPKEYLAPAEMIEMAKSDGFDFWALRDGSAFVGFMTVMTCGDLSYLFFLAIDKAQRSRGYGAKALRLLRAVYPDKRQVVDIERLDARAGNERQREERRAFYLRNGYRATGQFLSYLGVEYEVLCSDGAFDPASFRALMKHIRIDGFEPDFFP